VFEWLVGFVTGLALSITETAKIYRVLKRAQLYRRRRICRVVDHSVTDVAIVSNHLAFFTHMLAVMTTKTTGRVEMPDVVWVSFPICFHLRKEVSPEDALRFADRTFNRVSFLRI
jgi:hypothetical protein